MSTGDPPGLQLTLPLFQGDVYELAKLVWQKRLAVEDVSMAQVTAQIGAHLRGDARNDLDEFGQLFSAAARLVVYKSAHVLALPMPASDEDVLSVPSQRISDRPGFRDAVHRLADREGLESFAPLAIPAILERPIRPRSATALARAWADIQERAARTRVTVAVPAFVHLETAVKGLIRRLRSRGAFSFSDALRGASRNDAVMHFVAVLELLRRREARAEQSEPFADIWIEHAEHGADEAFRAG